MLISESLSLFLRSIWQSWGWLFLILFSLFWLFLLIKLCLFLYLWWRRELWLRQQKFILLEIKIPKEILKPIRAMENVFAGLCAIYDPPDWWEKWIDGKMLLSISLEIVSIGGGPHFFIRIPEPNRAMVEANIYSQYPEAEITLVDDYTKYVPQDIPNKYWDLWASDYILAKDDSYPIKTYQKFETEREVKEEKRIDPLAGLLEAMAKIRPGEQLWIQITAQPVRAGVESDWVERGKKIRDEIARRKERPKPKSIIGEVVEVLIRGKPTEAPPEEKEIIPPEMKLTPGEREIISGVEEKISRPGFETNIRFIYLGKTDVFFKPNCRLAFSFFANYATENLNGLYPWKSTLTKIHKSWFLPLNLLLPRRLYLRKRRLFRNYIKRLPPLFPRAGGTFIFNTEELASLYHFPSRAVAAAPFVTRVEAKKGEAPPGLPVE